MTLTIELKPELEAQLRIEAENTGVETTELVVNALEERLQRHQIQNLPSHLSEAESSLFQIINKGVHEETWDEYHNLVSKRRDESLTAAEHLRLISLADKIESAHVVRMSKVAELAKLRGISMTELMMSLGLKPREV